MPGSSESRNGFAGHISAQLHLGFVDYVKSFFVCKKALRNFAQKSVAISSMAKADTKEKTSGKANARGVVSYFEKSSPIINIALTGARANTRWLYESRLNEKVLRKTFDQCGVQAREF